MNKCKTIKRLLSSYLDKETNSEKTALVEIHVDSCLLCKEELLALQKIKYLVLSKEQRTLPQDYLVNRLREEILNQQYCETRPPWIVIMGNLSRMLIPLPGAVIVLSIIFLISISNQQVDKYSLEEHILSGTQTTTEIALGLI